MVLLLEVLGDTDVFSTGGKSVVGELTEEMANIFAKYVAKHFSKKTFFEK